jgi:hypothetical protein
MMENPGDTGCSFVQLSVHNDTPAIDIGSIWIAAYPIPWIVLVILCVANTYKKRNLQSIHESKDAAKAEKDVSPPLQSQQPWTAPNLGLELLRIAGFLSPMALFACLVAFCFSCMTWRWVLAGLSATPPSLDYGILFGGTAFLLTYVAASYPRDKTRAERPPMETLRNESWFCAKVAERALVLLLVAWMAGWVLSQLIGVYLGCVMIWLLSGHGCKNVD